MKIYFACDYEFGNNLYKYGVDAILQSFYYLRNNELPKDKYKYYLIDSGGFSILHKGARINVYDYAYFLNKNNIKVCFNLDTFNMEESIKNQKILEKETNSHIIPVYHYFDYINSNTRGILKEWIEEYKYIGLGGISSEKSKRKKNLLKFFDYCYGVNNNKALFHGFGITSDYLLERYPFLSVDSTSWQRPIRYCESEKYGYGSKLNKSIRMRKREERIDCDIKCYLYKETIFTKIWEGRGIKYDERQYQYE
jgi:hypothetical protein